MTHTPATSTQPPAKGTWAIRTVLVLAVIVAVVVGVLGVRSVSRALEAAERAEETEALAEALPDTFDLAVNLSFERDAVMAGSPPVVLRPLQQTTDESAQAWLTRARKIDDGEGSDLDAALVRINRGLSGIDELRVQTRNDLGTGSERYTALINDLFSIAGGLPRAGGGQTASSIEALGHMPEAWESLGQERTIVFGALSESPLPGKKPISDEEIAALAEAEAGWRASLAAFYEKSSSEQRRALDELTDGTATEGAAGVPAQQAVNELIGGGGSALTLEAYAVSSTAFMRGLHEVLIASAQELVEDRQTARAEAQRSILAGLLLTLAALGALVVLVLVLAVILVLPLVRRRITGAPGSRGSRG